MDKDVVDYLIVGQGLAGSAMAMALLEQGASVIVLDREDMNSASRVAAGLVTTVAGKGMNLSWRQAEYLPEAMAYYHQLEQSSGQKLFHSQELLRLFDSEKRKVKFENKIEQLEGWVAEANKEDLARWNSEHGGFVMLQGGWLDTNAYLEVVRDILGARYRVDDFSSSDLTHADDGIEYRGVSAKSIILCQGVSGLTESNNLFSHVEHRSANGEILRVKIEGQSQHQIISNNGWMVPVAKDEWRVGATYEWSDMEGETTAEGRAEVEKKLKVMTDRDYQIIDHQAGVRPIMRKSQPYVGAHPDHPRVKFFNGLGSKGVISGPSVAKHFADHLVNGTELDPELTLEKRL